LQLRLAQDRAHVVAVAVIQIVDTHPNDPVRAVAAYLRDEFTDIEQQLMTDLKVSD
jgi:hypothetical protein